jgi:hypothetical protein
LLLYIHLSVVIAFPSAFANKQALARIIKKTARERGSVHIEGNCIVCQSSEPVELASRLARLFGIEKVAIAKKASSNFSDLSNAIVEVGSKIIMPGNSFYVKVIIQQAAKYDYVSRDVEFAASGTLTARLSSINARPAKSEQDASHLILTVVGRESAYVCIQVFSAPGGLVAGSQGRVLSSIHSSLSFLSCLMAAKAGFESIIVLPYADESELESNAKLAQIFATKTGTKKQTILVMPINVSAKKGADALILKEKMMSKILICHEYSRIVFPLTTAVHPIWLIESIMQETLSAGKTPFAPLVFMSSELVPYAEDAGIELDLTAARVTRDKLQKYSSTIDSEAKVAIRHTKRLELKVGPNYLHDIIDSI